MSQSEPLRRRVRRKSLAVFTAAACATTVAVGVTNANAGTVHVSGTATYGAALLLNCPVGAVLCTNGALTGSLNGTFAVVITSFIPSPNVGTTFYSGSLTLHTSSGNLRCALSGALNILDADGEFGEICVITGGTGAFQNSTGHLELTGVSTDNPPVIGEKGSGNYTGTIVGTNLG